MGNSYSRFGTSLRNSSKQGDCTINTNDNMQLELNANPINNKTDENDLEPRSPTLAICRTPINEFLSKRNTESNKFGISPSTADALKDYYENPQRILKTKLLKGLHEKKLIDPRSPNQFINRTPIVFDNGENTLNDNNECDTSFNMNDTFSDLFTLNTKSTPTTSNNYHFNNNTDAVGGNGENENKLKPIINLQFNKIDPRSPTLGVDRTPIIISEDDYDNDNEDIMIENLLDSMKVVEKENSTNNKKITTEKFDKKSTKKVSNKNINNENSMNIYEDADQKFVSTPKRMNNEQLNLMKRTPLGCMRNSNNIEKNNGSGGGDAIKQFTKMKFGLNKNNLALLKNSIVVAEIEENKNLTIPK